MRRRLQRHGVVLTLAAWALSEPFLLTSGDRGRALLGAALVALPLLARRRHPVLAAGGTFAIVLLDIATSPSPRGVAGALCLAAAGYALGAHTAQRGGLPVRGLLVAGAFLAAARALTALDAGGWEHAHASTHLYLGGIVVGGLCVGAALRDRTEQAAALRREVEDAGERAAAALTRAASRERAAIAERLDAIVDDVARRLPPREGASVADPRGAAASLRAAERLANDALEQLGRLLGVLHRPPEHPAVPAATRPPRSPAVLLGWLAPWLLFAAFGTLEQLALPDRPVAIAPGIVVAEPAYPLAVSLVLCWVTPLPLLARHRAPLAAIAAIGVVLVCRTAAGDLSSLTSTQHFLGVGTAFLAGASLRTLPTALGGAGLAATMTSVCWALEELTMSAAEWGYLAVLLAASWATGRAVARQAAAATRTRSEIGELDGRREALEREVLTLERRRVAREVHDLVGHGLSLMSIQAAVAAGRLERGDDAVAEAVHTVWELAEGTQRELAELHAVLQRAQPTTPSEPGEDPSVGLDAVRDLVATARRHGHEVDLVGGDLRVPRAIAAAVTDVVRESLTNVRKHAGPVPTEVRVRPRAAEGAIEVVVANPPGDRWLGEGTSLGLRGLAERVQAVAGRLDAGPAPGGGWRVTCLLPCGPPQAQAGGSCSPGRMSPVS